VLLGAFPYVLARVAQVPDPPQSAGGPDDDLLVATEGKDIILVVALEGQRFLKRLSRDQARRPALALETLSDL